MRYGTPGALRMALERRLLDMSRQTGLPLTRLRKAVAFERILARLVRTKGNWVLKGAVALEFRKKVQTRATKDLDLGYPRAADDALPKLQAAARQDLGDGFVFAVERSSEISEDDPGAVRFLVRAELAGRTFEDMRVDVAFGDPLIGKPERVKGPGLLEFAGIEAPVIPALPLEQHVAEKVHAYTRTYSQGQPSSRPKDLVDLILIGSFAQLDADRLREALDGIFVTRAMHALPQALPAPPANWRRPYMMMAVAVGLDGDLGVGHGLAARLVDPVLQGSVKVSRWDPAGFAWIGLPARRPLRPHSTRSPRPPARHPQERRRSRPGPSPHYYSVSPARLETEALPIGEQRT